MSEEYEALFATAVAPEDLAARARSLGWPDGLLEQLLTLRFDRPWIERAMAEAGPTDWMVRMAEERTALSRGTIRVRLATRHDGQALSELFLASPEPVGDWDVTVDRRPNAFAQFDLQEHAMVVLLEDRSVPLACFSLAAKNATVGGQKMTVRMTGAWRTRQEARGLGYSALIRNNWGSQLDLPRNTPGDFWYIRSQNSSAVAWMRALDETLLISTRERPDDVPGIPVSVHELAAQPVPPDPGIRPARRDDLARCVALVNRTHRGLDLFRPYSEEYLADKLDEGCWGDRATWWEPVYSWADYFVVEREGKVVACAGLWDKGRDVREVWRHRESGDEEVRSVTNVLDLGCARGADDELGRLLRYFSGRTHELGRDALVAPLQFLPRVRGSVADLRPQTTTRGLAWRMYGPEGIYAEPPVEPLRPYTDLAYW